MCVYEYSRKQRKQTGSVLLSGGEGEEGGAEEAPDEERENRQSEQLEDEFVLRWHSSSLFSSNGRN